MLEETRCPVGPVPTTSSAAGVPAQSRRASDLLVDMPGIDERDDRKSELLAQAERADLIMWVASATQTAREPDRKRLADFRAWASAQITKRAPPLLPALTHVDELRPAIEWTPPYDSPHRRP
jgi:predicted GTPase